MAPSTPSAERIEQQMQSLRSELCADARSLVSGARDLTDWTAYVRRYPWLCLGAAAAIGYLAIPRRRRDLRTADPAADQAAERPVVVMSQPPQRPSLTAMVIGMATTALVNGGIALASKHLEQLIARQADRPNSAPRPEEHAS